jgi:protein-S-isoprenylcysteine O-methyltransferase Ste14
MLGFLLQWPTLLTLAMFPVLVTMYVRLAIHEEAEARVTFADTWARYAERTPRFLPRIGGAVDNGPSIHARRPV